MSAENKVYKKRPHRKVKSGCTICKKRKIKCDETRPQCHNCQRYTTPCTYPPPSISISLSTSHSPTSLSPPSQPRSSHPSDPDPPSKPALAITDLLLMHQWSTTTSYGFGDSFPGEVDHWRDHLPVLAQHFPFLMRGILATSALHLSRTSADELDQRRYIRLAAYHQDLALPEYRRTLAAVTQDNATAVLAFSALLVVHSFAVPGTSYVSGLLEWVFLHRGVADVPARWFSWVRDAFLERQMRRRRLGVVDPAATATVNEEDDDDDGYLLALRDMIQSLPAEVYGDDVKVYEDTVYWLRQAFAHTRIPGSGLGPKYAVLFFIERVPQRYIDLLGSRDTVSMVFMAFICVLLKRAEAFWYFEGFARNVMRELEGLFEGDFRRVVEWPLRICGIT
ncbi:hypothetical protein CC80DRAFT_44100 [Byssothecium circinans]|uniref:Zn(2)-C6 fungal-type domain-containing protein n=1 Tax=Byssothecium circinans TaxID=147558 RepID=A0A6A5TYJ8_9PLEO|nr:hypothetical protein CC80DRAFT_44100 [Byssothecium circinans]